MLRVNFYLVDTKPGPTQGDSVLEATIFLDANKKIQHGPIGVDPSIRVLYQSILDSDLTPKEKKLKAKDPEKWMRTLPRKYSGRYMQAILE
jgi:hypothetical protein